MLKRLSLIVLSIFLMFGFVSTAFAFGASTTLTGSTAFFCSTFGFWTSTTRGFSFFSSTCLGWGLEISTGTVLGAAFGASTGLDVAGFGSGAGAGLGVSIVFSSAFGVGVSLLSSRLISLLTKPETTAATGRAGRPGRPRGWRCGSREGRLTGPRRAHK